MCLNKLSLALSFAVFALPLTANTNLSGGNASDTFALTLALGG